MNSVDSKTGTNAGKALIECDEQDHVTNLDDETRVGGLTGSKQEFFYLVVDELRKIASSFKMLLDFGSIIL